VTLLSRRWFKQRKMHSGVEAERTYTAKWTVQFQTWTY